MIRTIVRRYSSSAATPSAIGIGTARQHCLDLLAKQDRSSFILQSYIPERARDAFIAVRAFNLETGKIADTASKPELAQMRFEFWKSIIQKSLNSNASSPNDLKSIPAEPVAVLLAESFINQGIALSKRFLITLVQTREQAALKGSPIRNIDSMCSYGEGTYSQLNYLTQEALYSVAPSPVTKFLHENPEITKQLEDMVAHIGQATGITTYLRGLSFYASKKNLVVLPVDVLAKHNVSQQSILEHFNHGAPLDPNTADVVFDTATRANDHILSAQSILNSLTQELADLPDAMLLPALTAVPVQLYLERLESVNFNLSDKKLSKPEWKLPYRSYKAYKLRSI